MAEFSKQYCERKFPEIPGDFDILEIAKNLSDGYYSSAVCEGYGFIAIGKDDSGSIILAFREDSDSTVWKPYSEVVV